MDAAARNAIARAVAVAALAVIAQAAPDSRSMRTTSNSAMQNDVETVVESFEGETHIFYRPNVCGSAEDHSRPRGADEPPSNREVPAMETRADERLSLNEIEEKFEHRRGERSVDKLLRSVGVVRRYKQEARETRVSNAARDQMTKLGSEWYVRQKKQGTKRPPAVIAREIEENIRDYAGRLLNNVTPFTFRTPKKTKAGEPQTNSDEKEQRRPGMSSRERGGENE